MAAEHFHRVLEAFDEVCDLPPEECLEVLAAWPPEDAEIVRDVQRLLEAERQGVGRLEPQTFAGELPLLGPPDPEPKRSLSGTRIAQFEVGERIGHGGMGEVYAGVDTVLRRKVALKAIRHDHRMSEAARRRFLREAQMLSSLDHPNICRIHDYLRGDEEDLLVLERIQGRSLREVMAEGLPSAEALVIAEQIAGALAAAHSEGVVHRDLKPSNVMLTADGRAKILDFGLARPEEPGVRGAVDVPVADLKFSASDVGIGSSIHFRTATGLMAGTPSAMSPEQIEGLPPTAASDMYSFGLLAQELFTGESPYDPALSPGELLNVARRGATRPMADIDRHLTDLIESLTTTRVHTRPTAPEVVAQLRWIRDKPKRRMRRVAAMTLFAIFALGSLKYTLDLRHERTTADQRRSQAEGLIDYMLGDLRTKLEPLGRLDVLDDVGDKALEYFASVPEAELSDSELSSRSKALTQIGEVRLSQNRYDDALASFKEAYRHSAALTAREPEDGDFLFDRGQTEYWVGNVHWRRLEGEKAQVWMERYRDTSEALLELDSTQDLWVLEMAYAHHNLAVLDLEFGLLEAAEAGFRNEVTVLQLLIERNTDDLSLLEDLADAYSWLGTTALLRGLLDHANEFFRACKAQRAALVKAEPENATWRFWWAQAQIFEGNILSIRGDWEESMESYGSAISVLEQMVATDRTNRTWVGALATARVAQAKTVAAGGEFATAREQLRSAITILEDLLSGEPGDRLVRRALLNGYRTAARLEGRLGASKVAVETIARAVEIAEVLYDGGQGDLDLLGEMATTWIAEGELHQAIGELDEARASWHRALELLAEPVRGSSFPLLLDPWARALAYTGQTEEAMATVMSLSAAGYRPLRQWPESIVLETVEQKE